MKVLSRGKQLGARMSACKCEAFPSTNRQILRVLSPNGTLLPPQPQYQKEIQ